MNIWCILQKLRWVKFFYRIFLMKMVKYPQTYPLIPKIPLGWSIKSKFWRIFKCTFMHVKYVVQRFVPRDLIFWSFAYCLTISESSCQPGSTGTQIWAQNSILALVMWGFFQSNINEINNIVNKICLSCSSLFNSIIINFHYK